MLHTLMSFYAVWVIEGHICASTLDDLMLMHLLHNTTKCII